VNLDGHERAELAGDAGLPHRAGEPHPGLAPADPVREPQAGDADVVDPLLEEILKAPVGEIRWGEFGHVAPKQLRGQCLVPVLAAQRAEHL